MVVTGLLEICEGFNFSLLVSTWTWSPSLLKHFSSVFRSWTFASGRKGHTEEDTAPDRRGFFPVKCSQSKWSSNRKWLSSPSLTAQTLGFPTGGPRRQECVCIYLGGDHRTQQEGGKEVRWGSKVTGNERSITEQFPAVSHWISFLPRAPLRGHCRRCLIQVKTPGTLVLLCSRFERKVHHRKLLTIQQCPWKGGTSRRNGVGGWGWGGVGAQGEGCG